MNKTYLVTGGSGSFGKAFVNDLLRNHSPKQIRVFSRDEYKQHVMAKEINDPRVEYLIGDVRDQDRLMVAMRGVDVVVHAAAMKRIEKCERDPHEAVKTNVLGTINVANAALASDVERCILISTDKAASPLNLYGATKMTAEKVFLGFNNYRGKTKQTIFSAVRYGNVLGSRGSVVQLFSEQAKEGVIRITHPDMTRFFITLQQAVDLVHVAVSLGQGGEIFLPKLKAIPITELANILHPEVPQTYVGAGAGEKMHEILYTNEEAERISELDNFCVINPLNPNWPYSRMGDSVILPPASSHDAARLTADELKSMVRA